MMKKVAILCLAIVAISIFTSCKRTRTYEADDETELATNNRRTDRDNEYREERDIRKGTKVEMRKVNGVYLVPIKVNGLDLEFIFDTGASIISLSSAEALVMLRQGQITEDDIVGETQFQDATGGISVGTIVRLRTVEIGGITLHNVEASVVDNIQAPLLLGQTALSKFGKVTIDYNNSTIEFN